MDQAWNPMMWQQKENVGVVVRGHLVLGLFEWVGKRRRVALRASWNVMPSEDGGGTRCGPISFFPLYDIEFVFQGQVTSTHRFSCFLLPQTSSSHFPRRRWSRWQWQRTKALRYMAVTVTDLANSYGRRPQVIDIDHRSSSTSTTFAISSASISCPTVCCSKSNDKLLYRQQRALRLRA